MKTIYLIFTLFCSLLCPVFATDATPGQIIEQTVFWDAKRDSRWTPVEMAKLVGNSDLFTQEGNFYKPKSKIIIFGHELVYAGMLGVDLYPGPNVTLAGKAKSVKEAIEKSRKIKMEEVEGGYIADLKKDIKLLIFPHPNKSKQTIVIGAYLGP